MNYKDGSIESTMMLGKAILNVFSKLDKPKSMNLWKITSRTGHCLRTSLEWNSTVPYMRKILRLRVNWIGLS